MSLLIKNGRIHDAVERDAYEADILVKDGKIVQIGVGLECDDAEVVDASQLEVYPGLVEAHTHIGLDGWGMGYEGADYNERNDPVTPHLRAIDGINPFDHALRDAALNGVTTVCTGPGSANVVGGTFAAMKTMGNCVDDMVIKAEVAMKCAFGENPKRVYRTSKISSRMTTAAQLREILFKSREYLRKIEAAGGDPEKMPSFDMKLNAMLPVMRGEMPLKAHAHQANDLMTAVRIAEEFGVKLTLEHVTDGMLVLDKLKQINVPLAVGPTFGHPGKYETRNKAWEAVGELNKAGCHVSIITDAGVIEQKHLRFCAAMAAANGMDAFEALKAVTIYAAEHIGISDRVGSIQPGKDADFVLTNGDLFDINTKVLATYINGEKVDCVL
ncbi:MAG: amidohydrolase [Christensenellales bacterium]|nr:amidohydrolase [Christensenellales bacterium]